MTLCAPNSYQGVISYKIFHHQ